MHDSDCCEFQELKTGTRGDLAGWLCAPVGRATRAGAVIVHGLGEHAGRYRETAAALASIGVASLAYDQQGHGRSPGRRGAPRSYESMLDDIDAARQQLRERISPLRQVMLGHSMGGNLAASYTLRWPNDLTALILTGPMFLPSSPPRRDQIFAAWLTGRMLPFIRINAPVSVEQLTHDEEKIRDTVEDPLRHGKMSLYLATQLLAQGRWALDHASEIAIPVLVLHGGEDSVTDASASHAFCLRVGDNATYVDLPGMYHEVLREVGREQVFDRIRDWLRVTLFESGVKIGEKIG